jgi:hypothetical protein
MHPEAFAFVSAPDGLARRHLGTFNERGFGVGFLKVSASTASVLTGRNRLLFVVAGELSVDGQVAGRHAAIQLDARDRALLASPREATVLEIVRPHFEAPFWLPEAVRTEAALA